jgi:hypothetical protein
MITLNAVHTDEVRDDPGVRIWLRALAKNGRSSGLPSSAGDAAAATALRFTTVIGAAAADGLDVFDFFVCEDITNLIFQ